MNWKFLLVDDIETTTTEIKRHLRELAEVDPRCAYIIDYLYELTKTPSQNASEIEQIIIDNEIDFIALDRKYSKKTVQNRIYYADRSSPDPDVNVYAEHWLIGSGLLKRLSQDRRCKLKKIFIYSYDRTSNVHPAFETLKENILEIFPGVSVWAIETSSIFNKPEGKKLYPSPKHDNSQPEIVGTTELIREYADLIAHVIYDIASKEANDFESYSNEENLQFDKYVRIINRITLGNLLPEYKNIRIGSVSTLIAENGREEYLVDIPYKEYYKDLNTRLMNTKINEKNLSDLFSDKNGYLEKQWIYYHYDYTDDVFNLLPTYMSKEADGSLSTAWLPYLHSAIFHDTEAWKKNAIVDESQIQKKQNSTSIFFLFTRKNLSGVNAHTNVTFYYENKEPLKEKEVEKIVNDVLYGVLMPLIYAKIGDTISVRLRQAAQRHATGAAISQVMARNMSHNIGSHVLSKIVTPESVSSILIEKTTTQSTTYTNLEELIKEGSIAISVFNSYLRNRMDYLADIATGAPVMEVTRQLVADVLAGFDKNRILIDRISGVDNFKYELEVHDRRDSTSPDRKLDGLQRDIPVSIPNDVMGYHAFYILLENIIRNTAKHGEITPGIDVKFIIEVRNCISDSSLYEVSIYDNIHKEGKTTLSEEEVEKYEQLLKESSYSATRTNPPIDYNNIRQIDWLVANQNIHLNKSFLNSQNKLRHGAWGLIEMEVSAAYLRKIAPEDTDSDNYEVDIYPETEHATCFLEIDSKEHVNILKAVNRNSALGYRFHMMKPKEMLIVDETGRLWQELHREEKLQALAEYGILALHTITGPGYEQREWWFNKGQVYSYPFMIVLADESGPKIDISSLKLPAKIILCQTEKTCRNETAVYCDPSHEIFDAIKETRVSRKDPFNDNTITDFAWKIWLQDKLGKLGKNAVSLNKADIHNKFIFDRPIRLGDNIHSIWLNEHGETIVQAFENGRCKYAHYEAYPSAVKGTTDKLNLKISKEDNLFFDKTVLYKVIEASLTTIVIVDERVQKLYKEPFKTKKGLDFTIAKVMTGCNTFVPSDALDLSSSSYDKTYVDLLHEQITQMSTKSYSKKVDFVVIHLGIIEKMLRALGKPHSASRVFEFVADLKMLPGLEEVSVIITSGRGKPDNLPVEVPFLAYSILSQYAVEIRFKSFLLQAIQNAKSSFS